MPISLKTIAGGSGDPINSIREIHTDELLYTTVEGTKWLRTGWVSTDISTYPLATRTTVPDDLTQTGFTQTAASTAQVDGLTGAAVEGYFATNPAKTSAAIPCGLTSSDLNNYILKTVDSGATWATMQLTTETTHDYRNGACGATRWLFVGANASNPTGANGRAFKTTIGLDTVVGVINITFPNTRFTCWTGTNFLVASPAGKMCRIPDATDTPTYLPDTAFTNTRMLVSPVSGVALLVDGSNTSNNIVARSTDDGSNWTTVLSLLDSGNWTTAVSAIYRNPVNSNLYCISNSRNIVSNNHRINIHVSTDAGATWNIVPWSFSWDGVTYDSVNGWPASVAPNPNGTSTTMQNIFRDSSGVIRIPLKFNSTRFCYLQSKDEGVSWTLLKPTTRTLWTDFDSKCSSSGFYLADLSVGGFVVASDMQSPKTNPVYKLQQDITYVGVPEELFTNITSTNSKLGKYTRLA